MENKLKLKPKKYIGTTSVVSLRMPEELIESLDKISTETGRTRNDIIIKCIDFALENIVIESRKEEK